MTVTAVVVTHQSGALLGGCLDALGAPAIVSDSGSTDGVEELCRARGVPFLPGPNRGFGAAVNRALPHVETPWVLVMNPDVTVEGDLAAWVAECDALRGCAVFAPRQVDQHGVLVPTMGREPSPADLWYAARTLDAGWVNDLAAYDEEARCDWAIGSFLLVRRHVLEEVGGFDERFFLFSEEVDLCTRVRRAGWEVAYLPSLTVVHRVADRPFDAHRERLLIWSELVYMRKWYGLVPRTSMRVALAARLARHLARRYRFHVDPTPDRVRLGAALRFRRSRYGPSQEHGPVADAPRQPAEQQA